MLQPAAKPTYLILVLRADYVAARRRAEVAVACHLHRSAEVDDEDALEDLGEVQTAAHDARTQLDAEDPDAAAWIAETFPRRAA